MSDLALYRRTRAWLRLTQLVLGVITPLLLSSLGGAGIAAAPILLPALWIVGRGSRSVTRGYFIFLAGLTAAEALWAATWELGAFSAVVPFAALVVTGILFPLSYRRIRTHRQEAAMLVLLILIGGIGAVQIGSGGTTISERVEVGPRKVEVERPGDS